MNRRPWSECTWLDLRAAELSVTTAFASAAIYQAAKILWQSDLSDERAADILVSIDSARAQTMGPVAFVDMALSVIDPSWLERNEL